MAKKLIKNVKRKNKYIKVTTNDLALTPN